MYRTSCLFCGSSELAQIMDLGLQPFADTFLKEKDLEEAEITYPLILDLCMHCGNVQSRCITSPDDRYVNHDYSYTSSNSAFARNHWDEYTREITQKMKVSQTGLIIEIGSNDGYLSEQFMKRGNKVVGVDPSPVMAKLAAARNVTTEIGLFNDALAAKLLKEYGPAELIIANNVFNHSDATLDFSKGVAKLLSPSGTFVFELPYFYIAVKDKQFDHAYHEHVTYLTVTSAQSVLRRAGMHITSAEVVNYHGGSLRVYAQRGESKEVPADAAQLMAKERELGLFSPETYVAFMKEIHAQRNSFLQQLYSIKVKGGVIIAVGAAAKGNTFLNFYNLNHKTIEYVTDASPQKKGKWTPYSRIPIVGDEVFGKFDAPYALILAWNLSDQLRDALRKINPKVEFISPWSH